MGNPKLQVDLGTDELVSTYQSWRLVRVLGVVGGYGALTQRRGHLGSLYLQQNRVTISNFEFHIPFVKRNEMISCERAL